MKECCENCNYYIPCDDYVGRCEHPDYNYIKKSWNTWCNKYIKSKERKITPGQIRTLYHNTINPEGRRLLKEWYPEEFKPKQGYCCDEFRKAVNDNSIVQGEVELCHYWKFGRGWVITNCFNCDQKPVPPIK